MICEYLALKGYFFWRQNTQPIFDKGKFRRMPKYAKKGVPDIILLKNGSVIFLEVKRPGGKLSESQIEFKEGCEKNKVQYCVITDLDEVIALDL